MYSLAGCLPDPRENVAGNNGSKDQLNRQEHASGLPLGHWASIAWAH